MVSCTTHPLTTHQINLIENGRDAVEIAAALGISTRAGRIQPRFDASLILVDGNPLEDISHIERISAVFWHGEALSRTKLLEEISGEKK